MKKAIFLVPWEGQFGSQSLFIHRSVCCIPANYMEIFTTTTSPKFEINKSLHGFKKKRNVVFVSFGLSEQAHKPVVYLLNEFLLCLWCPPRTPSLGSWCQHHPQVKSGLRQSWDSTCGGAGVGGLHVSCLIVPCLLISFLSNNHQRRAVY